MAQQNITLIAAAKVFDVHPRTIVRALSGEHNTYWFDDINENLYAVADIATAYGMSANELSRCIEGRDELIKPDEAAQMLGVQPRTLRRKSSDKGLYKKVSSGGVVRYFKSRIIEAVLLNTPDTE